jgi:RNA polymerase sigma factor (sigma-70 family)
VWSVVADDPRLAEQFSAGDPDAIRALYQRYGRLVYSVAYKVLGDVSLSEDATQQAFIQAWRAASSYDPARELGPWLATIARRAAIDVFRREQRHRDVDDLDGAAQTLTTPPPSIDQIYDAWEVRKALDGLPDQDRELIRLQHFGSLTHTEISQELAIPLGTVKSRSFRAHRRMADLLGHLRAEPINAGPTNTTPINTSPPNTSPTNTSPTTNPREARYSDER